MGCTTSSVVQPNHSKPLSNHPQQQIHYHLNQPLPQQPQKPIQINAHKQPQLTQKKHPPLHNNAQYFMVGQLNQTQQIFAKVDLSSLNITKMSIPQGFKCYNFSSFLYLEPNNYFISGGINHTLTNITPQCYIYHSHTHSVQTLAPMQQPRYTHSSIFDSESQAVYVIGGRYYGDDSQGILDTCEKYLIQQNKWIQLPSMNVKRCTCFTLIWNNKIYAFGGYTGPYQRSTVIQYLNQTLNKWEILQVELYRGLEGAIMVSNNANQVTIFGGLCNSGSTDSVVTINLKNNSIISNKKLKSQRSLYKAFSKNDKIYFFGGDQQLTCQVYDTNLKQSQIVHKQLPFSHQQLDSLAFSTKSVIVPYLDEQKSQITGQSETDQIVYIFGTTEEPFICELNVSLPLASFKAVPLPLKLYVYQGGLFINSHQIILFGGIQDDSFSVINAQTLMYDIKKNLVNKLANMNQNMYSFTYQLVKNSKQEAQYIYCMGGATSNTKGQLVFLSACERYNIQQNKWQLICPLPKKLISPMSVVFNKRIFVFGGTDDQKSKNKKVYHYQEKENKWLTLETQLMFGIQGGSVIQVSKNEFYVFGGLLENGQSAGIWSLYLSEKGQNKKQCTEVIFYEKGQMSQKKCQHKIYKPRNQQFYVIFGGNKDALSFYNNNLEEQKSDSIYNLKSMFMSVLEKFNTKTLKGYLILSPNDASFA